jgi:hypothetical protein
MQHDKKRGLLVVARDIGDDIRAKLDWTAQQLLNPITKFLDKEIDAAIEMQPDDVLGCLARKFVWSLHFTPPQEVPLTAGLFEDVLKDFAKFERRKQKKQPTVAARTVASEKAGKSKTAAIKLVSAAAPEFEAADSSEFMFPYWAVAPASKAMHHCT